MNEKNVILISSGLLSPKKDNNELNKQSLYPNYGLISLATILKENGYSPTVIHGDYEDPQRIIELMFHYRFESSKMPVLLSIPSFFSVSWAKVFCDLIHENFKNKKIVVGGKWVVDGNESWIRSKLYGIDSVVSGNAEKFIVRFLDRYNPSINIAKSSSTQLLPEHIDYKTVHNFRKYQPSIELARGCGSGCSFCLEKDSPYTLLKYPSAVVTSMLKHMNDYDDQNITPYLQTSIFKNDARWCEELRSYYNKHDLKIQWRTQTRIDSMSVENIKTLSESGLKVLDFGLESASPLQLLRMGKTKAPDKYLEKASKLLNACYEHGVWAKVNILLYAGETLSTVKETETWLDEHNTFIKGLSINPLFIYKHPGANEFIKSLEKHGASLVCPNSLDEFGYSSINLSNNVDFKEANNLSLELRQKLVSENDYFDLKSFSYFDRRYTVDSFKSDLHNMDDDKLPFHRALPGKFDVVVNE